MGTLYPICFCTVGTVLAVSLKIVPAVHAYEPESEAICWVYVGVVATGSICGLIGIQMSFGKTECPLQHDYQGS